MPVSSADGEDSPQGSILERLRSGDWPRFEGALVLLVASSPLSKPLTNVALALAVVLFVRDWRLGRRRPRPTPLDGAIAAWVFASLLSGLTSIDPVQSFRDLRNLGHWSAYYLIAWGVAEGASLRRLQNAWLAAGAACAVQAVLQAGIGFDLLGRAKPVATGFFGGHLELGHYMVILLALAIARCSYPRSTREREVLFAALGVFGAALVLSGGRGPWLAFVAVGFAWMLFRRNRAALGGFALVVLLQFVFLVRQPQGLEAFYRSYVAFDRDEPSLVVSEDRLVSNLWRLSMWREGLKRFAVRPLAGTGVETTRELSQDFRTPFRDLAVAHLHSNYFEILMTRGFFGLTAFFFLLLAATRLSHAGLAGARDGETVAVFFTALAAIIAHFAHGLTQFTFGATWIQIGFYLALGMGVGAAARGRPAGSAAFDSRAATWVVATIATAFAVLPWLSAHPWLPGTVTIVAALDIGARLATGKAPVITQALFATIAFVSLATLGLLGPTARGEAEVARVVAAACIPFAVCWLSWRLFETAGLLKPA